MKKLWMAVGLTLALAAGPALAGRSCEEQPLDAETVRLAMGLAERTAKRLDETGAQVVALARAGQDLGQYGITWSHFGFAYREAPAGNGPAVWRVTHKLNQCGSAVAAVYRQGLGEFFLDRMFRYQAAIVVLAPEVQERLLPVLRDNQRVTQWHAEAYNMLAYPWAQTYQQSNQWAIETMAGAMDTNAVDRGKAQAWLQLRGYQPATLHLGAMTRLGARATKANVAFDDHPNEKRFSNRIETVTVDSVFEWLRRSRLGGEAIVVY
jgi:hypothetical protein